MEKESLLKVKAKLDDAYYNRGESLVSDEEYDVLKRQIEMLEGEQPVGAKPTGVFEKFERKEPMLSLGNVFTPEEHHRWLRDVLNKIGTGRPEGVKFVAEPKLDGLSLELRYKGYRLVSASTRGDGTIGENVTENASRVHGVSTYLGSAIPYVREEDEIVVRGEVVALKVDFRKYNEMAVSRGERAFVSPRSMAVGSLKQRDPEITASRHLTFFAYQVNYGKSATEAREFLKRAGFLVPWLIQGTAFHDMFDMDEAYDEFVSMRDKLAYETDGVVFKVDDFALREKLGETSSLPNWAVAWKFKAQRAETVLRDVEWRVGRTGKVVPRATFDPVFVAGATLTHASLHSLDIIKKLEEKAGFFLHPGCKILVERSGDVIPYVSSITEKSEDFHEEGKRFLPPLTCPKCDEFLTDLVSGELRCENPECNFWEKVFHFMRTVFGMKGAGPSIIPALENAGVEKFADLFKVQKHHVTEVDGLGESTWRIFHENVERVRREGIPFDVFLRALGVRGVGRRMSTAIAKKFQDIEALMGSDPEEVGELVEGVGTATATRLMLAVYVPYTDLVAEGVKINSVEQVAATMPLSGKTVCFTGSLSMPRKKFEEMIVQLGGTPVSSVSGKLDILVLGEKPGSKLQKAEKLGVEIRDESWVKGMMEGER